MTRPLPRSLDLLPDESLPGYLLRLAHRLDLTPARIMALTLSSPGGLRHPCRSSHELMVELDPPTRELFTVATHLDTHEAEALTLGSLGTRFPIPPTDNRLRTRRYGNQPLRSAWWMFTDATRYCPQCLAGDGSAIQQAHGGAWRRTWRLPIMFACLQHRQLLQHLCPDCRRPALGNRANGERVPLLPGTRLIGLHPAQCRWPGQGRSGGHLADCGARLDTSDSTPELSDAAIRLQHKLIQSITPGTPTSIVSAGLPTEPRRYLTDLRLLTQLVASSWPRARHLLSLTEFADAIDTHLEQHGHDTDLEATRRRQQPGKPLDPSAGASLLSIADHIVSHYDSADTREIVRALLPSSVLKTNRTGWALTFTADRDECSPGFARTISPLVKRYSRQPRTTTYTRAAILRTTLEPEHIPQWLSTDRFHRHFDHLDGISPHTLRRITTIRLFQMAFGGSAGNAADYLGIPTRVTTLGTLTVRDASTVQTWAHRRNDPDEFDRAVAALAADLEQSPRNDYHKRRLALRNWSIPPTRWAEIIDPLTNSRRVTQRPDHQRIFASTLVWATVTSGNRRYAPMAAQTNTKQNTWAFPNRQRPNQHLRIMKALDELAHELVNEVDEIDTVADHR